MEIKMTQHAPPDPPPAQPPAQALPLPGTGKPRTVGMWRDRIAIPEGWDKSTDQDAADWYGE
jgi:hypothetical protein